MIVLFVILYLVLGYFTICLMERFSGIEASPNFLIALIFWPIAFLGALVFTFLTLLEKIEIKTDKLRKWIRGWE